MQRLCHVKIMALCLLISAVTLSATVCGQDAIPEIRQGLEIEDLGVPVYRRELANSFLFRDIQNGHLHLFLTISGGSGFENDPENQFLDFNLDTGEIRSTMSGIVNGSGYRSWFHPNGKLYLGGGRPVSLIEYDPATGEARFIGYLVDNFYHAVQSIDLAPDGKLYFGHYGCHVTRYDPETDEIDYLGLIGRPRNNYVYTIASDGRYVYAGMNDGWYLSVLDTETGEQEVIPDLTGNVSRDAEGNIYFGNRLMRDGKPVPREQVEAAKRDTEAVPLNSLMSLMEAEKSLGIEFDLGEMNPTSWNGGMVAVRWREKDAEEYNQLVYEGVAIDPNPPAIMAATPEGKLIGMGSHYGPIFMFDPETAESELLSFSPCSIAAFLAREDFIYFAGYSAQFWIYDRAKPWTLRAKGADYVEGADPNPVNIGGAGKWPIRIIEGASGRIYSVGNYGRHLVGGDAHILDPDTGEREYLRQDFEEYNIRDMVGVNGGRSIVISAVARDEDRALTMFVYDDTEGRIVHKHVIELEAGDVGRIMPAGDKTVLGIVDSQRQNENGENINAALIYKMNIQTGEVLFQKWQPGRAFQGPLSSDYGSSAKEIVVGPDGCGWLCIDNNLVRVRPDGDVEHVLEMPHGARMVFHGNDLYLYNGGRQWYGGFASVWRINDLFE